MAIPIREIVRMALRVQSTHILHCYILSLLFDMSSMRNFNEVHRYFVLLPQSPSFFYYALLLPKYRENDWDYIVSDSCTSNSDNDVFWWIFWEVALLSTKSQPYMEQCQLPMHTPRYRTSLNTPPVARIPVRSPTVQLKQLRRMWGSVFHCNLYSSTSCVCTSYSSQ